MGSKGRYLKKCPKPCLPRSEEIWTTYTPLKHYLVNVNSHTPRETHFLRYKSLEHLKNLKKWRRPLFSPGTNHINVIKSQNPSRETVSLMLVTQHMYSMYVIDINSLCYRLHISTKRPLCPVFQHCKFL
jgi:hypothetical protein